MVQITQSCRLLLQQLYNQSQKSRLDEHVLSPEQVAAILRVKPDDTVEVVNFLEGSGYIKCGRPFGRPYSWIKLTSKGMELVLNTSDFEHAFDELAPTAVFRARNSDGDKGQTEAQIDDLVWLADGANMPTEFLIELKKSVDFVMAALKQQDDQPLRDLLTTLILKGGLETTVIGVKALLSVNGFEV